MTPTCSEEEEESFTERAAFRVVEKPVRKVITHFE
jgi:hypothetical protein